MMILTLPTKYLLKVQPGTVIDQPVWAIIFDDGNCLYAAVENSVVQNFFRFL